MAAVQFGAVHRQGRDKKQVEAAVSGVFEMLVVPLKSGDQVGAAQVKVSKQIVFRVAKGLKDAL